MPEPTVVIVGAGFGGLECARSLVRKPVRVLLIDRNNYHLFTPLLYQVASSLLNPGDIAYPIRSALRGAPNVRFRMAEVSRIDPKRRLVTTAGGESFRGDYLVLATGSTTNYFGLDEVTDTAHGLKDLPEALELRNHILRCFEEAAGTADEAERRRWLTFVVVGGGPTGVEYAGALSELIRLNLAPEFPELEPARVSIFLLEAAGQLLPAFRDAQGRHALEELARRRVTVRLNARVVGASPREVRLGDGASIEARTLVWAAGVKPMPLPGEPPVPRASRGRIATDPHLRVQGHERVFAIGDLASVQGKEGEIPMLAPPAMQEGRWVARQILRRERGLPPEPFHYRDRGVMATIGRNSAVAQIGRVSLRGFLGWISWLCLHLYFLIGFRNRLLVLLGWAWDYLRYERPIRIITRARPERGEDGEP